jgi:serine protease Do
MHITTPSRTHRGRRVAAAAIVAAGLSLVAAACGSDGKDAKPAATTVAHTPTTKPASSTPATTTPTTARPSTTVASPPGTIAGVDDAQRGTVQIIAKGSLRDPEVGIELGAGSGSGFFIDGNGIAVTNNHVVTGAATLEVFVGGDTTKSFNAHVLGVSECNDLAVIQVDGVGRTAHFDWFDGAITAGTDVFAAGYPLGDPQFTLTKGIVAKAKAAGDLTGTSSIDHTLEHDANIQPGNSGGPLLTSDGKVLGVNYAGGARATTTEQFFAIASDLAEGVVAKLEHGDFESLGINGSAVADPDSGLAGIWVAGVAPGSPAATTGILPGDIVTSMNGLPVGTDGTFKDYCDVIRTAGTKPIAVDVLRFDTKEVLRGEINGDQPLATTFSFADQVEDDTDTTVRPGAAYTHFVSVTDDSGRLSVEVPVEWSDTDTTPISADDGTKIPRIEAAPDLDSFRAAFDTPGVQFAAAPAAQFAVADVLTVFGQSSACTDGGTFDYDDGKFVGRYQIWTDCGGTDTKFVVLGTNATAGDTSTTFATIVQVVTEADLGALDHIMATFDAA